MRINHAYRFLHQSGFAFRRHTSDTVRFTAERGVFTRHRRALRRNARGNERNSGNESIHRRTRKRSGHCFQLRDARSILHCHFTFRRHGTHRAGAFQADRRRSHEEKALFLQIHPSPDPDSGCHFLTEPDSRPHRFHSGSDSAPAPCF